MFFSDIECLGIYCTLGTWNTVAVDESVMESGDVKGEV